MAGVQFNNRTNMLEENTYKYQLQDAEEGNYFRSMFEYTSVPKVAFNNRVVPMNVPDEIWLTDTTFRDGQQSRSPFTVKQVVDLYKLMSRLGGPKGLIRQSEFFPYSPSDLDAIEQCLALGLQFPEVTTWIRAAEQDFSLIKSLGIKETGILVSCSDYHIFRKMNLNRQQALDKYLGIIKQALDLGIRPRCHFEDVTRADFYGFVVPFANELVRLSNESGIRIKIRLCDTLGFGVTYPGVALPRSVQGIVYGLTHLAEVPSDCLEWHGHNDFYKVVTNATTAWLYGCSAVNGTLLGLGERTGNCPLEAMLIEYAQLRGTSDGIDFPVITEIAEYFEKEIGYPIPFNTPFVGSNFNATRAGIHADGLLKDEEIYNVFDTARLLNRPATVTVDKFSGLAGIAYWINAYYRIPKDMIIDKHAPIVAQMKELIDAQYDGGRNTSMGPRELRAMLKSLDTELHDRLLSMHRKDKEIYW
ncbi:MAG: 2-isopropylmalate synthase [Christensenellaceae bacterium]|jgi:isopropylmalate/homocitrate/citramalate synthase|nr:2-isopropylmalate synthase [Christensenellaceae bacterium]